MERILIVDDSPTDVLLVQRALAKYGDVLTLLSASDGVDALQLLERAYLSQELPSLVLLDLNLPAMDGIEVLSRIKGDPRWTELPVVMMSTSDRKSDVRRAYRHHASGYVAKPMGFSELQGCMDKIIDYWFDFVLLPA